MAKTGEAKQDAKEDAKHDARHRESVRAVEHQDPSRFEEVRLEHDRMTAGHAFGRRRVVAVPKALLLPLVFDALVLGVEGLGVRVAQSSRILPDSLFRTRDLRFMRVGPVGFAGSDCAVGLEVVADVVHSVRQLHAVRLARGAVQVVDIQLPPLVHNPVAYLPFPSCGVPVRVAAVPYCVDSA